MRCSRTRTFFLTVALSALSPSSTSLTLAQEAADDATRSLPEGMGLSNQMKYSYDRDVKREIFEDWMNLDYRYRMFSAGLRFDVFQPNDPNPAVHRGKIRYADIAYKYFKAEVGTAAEGGELTVGNFYALFGRGLVLRSYEDRNIRIDNNLLGAKVVGRYQGVTLTALTGRVENITSQRIDALHAFDLEYSALNELKIGGSFASNQPDNAAARTRLASLRIRPSLWNFDMYAEYGIKQNDDIKERVFHNDEWLAGRAAYIGLDFYEGSFSITGEYKHYDNFTFFASDQATSFNTPPAVRRDYAFILLNRHPSPLDQNNEQGFQMEANYIVGDETHINASYGLTRTLGPGSFYQRTIRTATEPFSQLKELFASVLHNWNATLGMTVACGYSEERSANVKSVTPILEARYALDERHSLKGTFEHQHVTDRSTQEQSLNDVLTLEYLKAPDITLSLVTEMQTREPDQGTVKRRFWIFTQVAFKMGAHSDATFLIGSRQEGNICIGGVCRYEPEFKGVELKLQTRF